MTYCNVVFNLKYLPLKGIGKGKSEVSLYLACGDWGKHKGAVRVIYFELLLMRYYFSHSFLTYHFIDSLSDIIKPHKV
ncbi:hypothetical protein A4G19_04985 [Pasteurellaceae bacterium Macca]|nr:hypothetical protein [Pasteurellaceae bacterium Macca]